MAAGSWYMTKGVFDRLRRDGVETAIKQTYWSNQVTTPANQRAIHKVRPPAGSQTPYAVHSVVSDIMVSQSAGLTAGTAFQYRMAVVQFACYGTDKPGHNENDPIAIAGLIVDAMENGKLSFDGDTRFITLTRLGDITGRDDDMSTVIAVQFQIEYELTVNLDRMNA